MNYRGWITNHRRSIIFGVLVLALAGIFAGRNLPVSLFPDVEFPRIVVDIDSGDRPAEQMALEVTRIVEETVRAVPGVQSIRSETARGTATVSIKFAWGQDMVQAMLKVQAAVTQVVPSLPAGSSFNIRHMAPELTPVFSYSLTSDVRSAVELLDLAKYQLSPLLTAIPGVARAEVLGGAQEEYSVEIDPARLDTFGLTIADVAAAIAANNVLTATGRVEDHYKLFLVMADSRLSSRADIAAIVIRVINGRGVRVSDVATVQKSTAPSWVKVTADGHPAVLLNVYQQPGGNTSRIADMVKEKLDGFAPLIPSDVKVANWYDQSELILNSATSVRDAILIGILLASIVIFIFIRNSRITLISFIIVPTVISITVLVMYILGLSFNIMTLGGMAAAVGLIIDDSIVLVEHIARRLHEASGENAHETIIEASQEFTRPLIGSSLATLVIHIPPAFLTGAIGGFFKTLSLTIALSLIVSFTVCWLVIPILADILLRGRITQATPSRLMQRINRLYARILVSTLARPQLALVGVLLLVAGGVFSFFKVGSGFMPEMDEGGFVLDYKSPPGTAISETDRLVKQVEAILKEEPDVATYSRRTGLGMGGGFHPPNEGDFFVRLKPEPRRDIDEVMDDVRKKIAEEVPGLDIEILQLMEDLIGDLTAVPQPIEVKLFADNGDVLRELGPKVAKIIGKIPGIVDVKDGVNPAGDALVYRVDRQKAAFEGVDPDLVGRSVNSAFTGIVSSFIQTGPKMVGIRVALPAKLRSTDDSLRALRIKAVDGHTLPLRRIASVESVSGQPMVAREDLKRMIAVTARLTGRDLGSAIEDVKKVLTPKSVLPQGVYYELGGIYAEQRQAFKELEMVIFSAAALVFMMLLILYEDFILSVSILAMPLLAMPAVFLGLYITGTQLNISAMMGVTMIIGIVTEVGVFYFSELRSLPAKDAGDPRDALVAAGINRFRPIAMTTLAAILTLMPLALGLGEGASMQQPLAIAMVAGLIAQLPLVLLVMPVLYQGLERLRTRQWKGPAVQELWTKN